MKKLLSLLGTVVLATSGITTLVANKPYESTINEKDKNNLAQFNNLTKIDFKSFYQNNIKNNLKDGINTVKYRFLWIDIYLNHETISKINNIILVGAGVISGVISILSLVLWEKEIFIATYAAVLIAQWYLWNIPSYDNGNGIAVRTLGPSPTVFIYAWSQ